MKDLVNELVDESVDLNVLIYKVNKLAIIYKSV
jgi:hypothetical protein